MVMPQVLKTASMTIEMALLDRKYNKICLEFTDNLLMTFLQKIKMPTIRMSGSVSISTLR